jgi:hypothetical protein
MCIADYFALELGLLCDRWHKRSALRANTRRRVWQNTFTPIPSVARNTQRTRGTSLRTSYDAVRLRHIRRFWFAIAIKQERIRSAPRTGQLFNHESPSVTPQKVTRSIESRCLTKTANSSA